MCPCPVWTCNFFRYKKIDYVPTLRKKGIASLRVLPPPPQLVVVEEKGRSPSERNALLFPRAERHSLSLCLGFSGRFLTWSGSVQPSGRIFQSRAKSQRIAAWELLYRVQHPGRYVSRLQTILHSDIAVNDPRLGDDHHNP